MNEISSKRRIRTGQRKRRTVAHVRRKSTFSEIESRLRHAGKRKLFVYSVLSLILLYTIVYSLKFAIGTSHMGDDIAYAFRAYLAFHGQFVQVPSDALASRTLVILPIGLFYALFGAGGLQSAGWSIFSFVSSVLLAYLVGRELYGDYAGLTAAFLLSMFPLAAVYSTTICDNVPLMMFASLAMYSMIIAQKHNSRRWYFVAGAAIMAAPLTTPEGFILWLMAGSYAIIELLRGKVKANRITLFIVWGFIAVLALSTLYNLVDSGHPFITFTANASYYSQTWRPDLKAMPLATTLAFYPNTMFPYSITSTLYSSITKGNLRMLANIVPTILFSYTSWTSWGLYFYVLVAAMAVLLLARDRRSYVPLLWFAVGMLVLEFGPEHVGLNPLSYVLMHRLERYFLLLAPAIVVIIAGAFDYIVRRAGKRLPRYAALVVFAAIVVVLVYTSARIISFRHEVNVVSQYSQIRIADYMSKLPNTTLLYADAGFGDITVYMHFENLQRFMYAYGGASNCSDIPAGAYVVMQRYMPNEFTQCEANWTLVLAPNLTSTNATALSYARPEINDLYLVPNASASSSQGTS